MLRVGLCFTVPLAFIAVGALSPARGQGLAFGWGGYTVPQYGYGFGCPPVYHQPYCSSYAYGYPFTLPGLWTGFAVPYYWGGYYPYRLGTYGYGNRFSYGQGLRYPVYRGFGGYRPGYPAYRGAPGLGYRGQFYGGGSRFSGGGFRTGGFRGGGRR